MFARYQVVTCYICFVCLQYIQDNLSRQDLWKLCKIFIQSDRPVKITEIFRSSLKSTVILISKLEYVDKLLCSVMMNKIKTIGMLGIKHNLRANIA